MGKYSTSMHRTILMNLARKLYSGVRPPTSYLFSLTPYRFVSRLPILASLNPLTMADLLRILTEVKSSLVSQYTSLFSHSGVEIRFTTPALRAIAQKAYDRGGGARGLRGIMESLLLDAMYDVPGSGVRYVLVDEGVVVGEKEAGYWSRGEGTAFWRAWSEEEERDKREQNDMGDKVV